MERQISIQLQLQHRLWSEALGASYAGADQIVGNPFDVVPTEYHCHIYSAAAWRLFQKKKRQNGHWMSGGRVRRAFANRSELPN